MAGADVFEEYERDLARIEKSGPWSITGEQREMNRAVFSSLLDIVPFDDIHKVNDCDLIYRFLVAKRWNVELATKSLREYLTWRAENSLNMILWEKFPAELDAIQPRYKGVNKMGQPVFYNRPDPKVLGTLLNTFPREKILRHHLQFIEEGRRICKSLAVDRVASVMDLSQMTMSIVTNPSAMGMMKEMSTLVQTQFPENMQTMFICNGGWSFTALWGVLKAFLDSRVQDKVQVVSGSGEKLGAELSKFIDLDQIPASYGGCGAEEPAPFEALAELRMTVPGTTTIPLHLRASQPAKGFDAL
jgi:hypothetical protein